MPAKFQIGDLVKVAERYDRHAGRTGRVADWAMPIKQHQERYGQKRYERHVLVDVTGSRFYWVEFLDRQPGSASAAEIDEFALEPVAPEQT